MTTGPRPTPHPIILHVDDSNNPVRLAEASSIYVTSATIVSATITTLSATNYLGLDLGNAGIPGGDVGQIQYKKDGVSFGGDSALTFNESTQTLGAVQIIVGNFSSTTEAFFNNIARAEEFSSITLSATSSRIGQLSATTISAVTVCAVNYNSLFDGLSFTNLDARYLNSSGESVTGSFYLQNLSAAVFSATTYLNLPSGAAVWNASALAGKPVTSTAPGQYEVLVFDGNTWVPSGIAGIAGVGTTPNGPENSIQFRVGSTFVGSGTAKFNTSFSGLELVNTSSTNLSSVYIRSITISATDYLNIPSSTPLWNAKKLQDYDIVKGTLIDNDILSFTQTGGPGVGFFEKTTTTDYAAAIYPDLQPTIHANLPQANASALRGFAVTSTAPSINNVLVYNGSVWTPSSAISLSTVSSTNLSSVSAKITGLSATTISATTWQGLPPTNASAFGGLVSGFASPTFGDLLIVGASNNIINITPAAAAPALASVLTNGSTGYIQFKGPLGVFSGDANLTYNPTYGLLTTSAIQLPSGTIYLAAPETPKSTYISNTGVNAKYIQVFDSLISPQISATTYNIFTKETSSTGAPAYNNQTITYDSTASKWKPGYTIYQATGTPAVGLGSNGDIYFQYLP